MCQAFPFIEMFMVRVRSALQTLCPLGFAMLCGCVSSLTPPGANKAVARAQQWFMGRPVNSWTDTTSWVDRVFHKICSCIILSFVLRFPFSAWLLILQMSNSIESSSQCREDAVSIFWCKGCLFEFLYQVVVTIWPLTFRLPLPEAKMTGHWTINHGINARRKLLCPTESHPIDIKVIIYDGDHSGVSSTLPSHLSHVVK